MTIKALRRVKAWLADFDAFAHSCGIPPVALADLRAVVALAEEAGTNAHLPPRSDERLAWIRKHEHCSQCLIAPIEEDRRGWAQPTCHDCMPPRYDHAMRPLPVPALAPRAKGRKHKWKNGRCSLCGAGAGAMSLTHCSPKRTR